MRNRSREFITVDQPLPLIKFRLRFLRNSCDSTIHHPAGWASPGVILRNSLERDPLERVTGLDAHVDSPPNGTVTWRLDLVLNHHARGACLKLPHAIGAGDGVPAGFAVGP